MKKFRIVGLLLVLCLISSSFVGVTFAKYTSTATGNDSAVVAKWEIWVNSKEDSVKEELSVATPTITFDLFNTVSDDVISATEDVHVKDAANSDPTTEQIIAPGTGGAFEFVIENKSEVDAEYTIELSEGQTYLPAGVTRIPVVYQVNGGAWVDTIASLNLNAIPIARDTTATVTVYWRWAFVDDVPNNTIDTKLGIAAKETNRPTVTVTGTITVSQVD